MPVRMRDSAPWCSIRTTRCSSAFASAWKPSRARWARLPKSGRRQAPLPFWVLEQLPPARDGIIPLQSNALALRFNTLRPGPDLAMKRPEQEAAQAELVEAPSVLERKLRARLGELVAAQAVEDEAGRTGLRGAVAGPGLYHRYNAV